MCLGRQGYLLATGGTTWGHSSSSREGAVVAVAAAVRAAVAVAAGCWGCGSRVPGASCSSIRVHGAVGYLPAIGGITWGDSSSREGVMAVAAAVAAVVF